MASDTPAASPPPTVDPQDPLPEGSWLWRRVFVFAIAAVLLAFQWWYAGALGNIALSTNANTPRDAILSAIRGLVDLLKRDQLVLGLVLLLYIAGASMEQVIKLFQTASVLKSGIGFRSSATATDDKGNTATSVISAGLPVVAPLPVPPPPVPAPPAVEVDAAPTSATK